MEYNIDGLTRKQVAILDIIWGLDDLDKVQTFVKSLPLHDRAEAQCLLTMVMHEAMEEMMPVFEDAGFPEVKDIIAKVR